MPGEPNDRVHPVLEFETEDDALAAALQMCSPGEAIQIHEAECNVKDDGYGCTCEPTFLRTGAIA
jgi:hypothetical protein